MVWPILERNKNKNMVQIAVFHGYNFEINVYFHEFKNNIGAKNDLTHYGKSKEKRSDCPLVTLALLVDSNGFPISSHIYKGNQSEPETLDDVLARLAEYEDRIVNNTTQSTLIMDRG
jgi:transposase